MQWLSVIFPIFKDTRESNIEKDECEHSEDISKSKGKVTHVLIFCIHDKNVYYYCYDYDAHFNIKIHIAIMCLIICITGYCVLFTSIALHLDDLLW